MSNPVGYLQWLETGDHRMPSVKSETLRRYVPEDAPIKVLGVLCPECNEAIWSRTRHDFRLCGCGASYVDGGRDYLRYGGAEGDSTMPVPVWINTETGVWELAVYEIEPKEEGDVG